MARKTNLLTHKEVQSKAEPGIYADGAGLYLMVRASRARGGGDARPPAKSWVFVYFLGGKRKEMGLGGAADVKLGDVRAKAEECRQLVRDGKDPKAVKPDEPAPAIQTFGAVADEVIGLLNWRNPKTRHQWEYSLKRQAKSICDTPVDEVSTEQLVELLKPVWMKTPESASRLRGRIEAVLDAASARGLREGANPARWRGHLSHLLPPRRAERGHFAALDYKLLPAFMAELRAMEGMSAPALRFAILTAARSGEVLGARRGEIDLAERVWTVPAERMKAGREHRVPLVGEALELATARLAAIADDPEAYLFPGVRRGRPLSIMSMEMVLRRAKRDVTVHGFRSSFRDWVGDETHHPREVAEAALAHVSGDKVERAYRRRDALAKRRLLMEAWEAFLRPPAP